MVSGQVFQLQTLNIFIYTKLFRMKSIYCIMNSNTIIDENDAPNMTENISDQFVGIYDSITLFKMQLSALQLHVKGVEKNIKKNIKKQIVTNKSFKRKRNPSGFAKPRPVSKELCEFMDVPENTHIARTEVTKLLINYIKDNNLIIVDPLSSKKKIKPDEKLQKLLVLTDEEISSLTYFNIQKHMNKHFSVTPSDDLTII